MLWDCVKTLWWVVLLTVVGFVGFSYLAHAVLPPDAGWPIAMVCGFFYTAAGYPLFESIGWWFSDTNHDEERSTLRDQIERDKTEDRSALAICVQGPLAFSFVNAVVVWFTNNTGAIIVSCVVFGVLCLLWLTVVLFRWPRLLMSPSFRNAR